MIRINQIKIPIFSVCPGGAGDTDTLSGGWTKEAIRREQKLLEKEAARLLKCRTDDIRKLRILRRSVDARDKQKILFVYSVHVRLHDSVTGPKAETENRYILSLRNKNILQENRQPFVPPTAPEATDRPSPVVVGSGPCGLFAALCLADAGLKPVILERGGSVDERILRTEMFFESGRLDPDCNIQFGEGGAGTFSDGKLNTSIKDPGGYIDYVLRTFVRFGAEESILYDQKPHIGTDVLTGILRNIREYILSKGGSYRFHTRFDRLLYREDETGELSVEGIRYMDLKTGTAGELPCREVILATGHSARDTFRALEETGILMEPKAFAVGVRIQHPQELIDRALYGDDDLKAKQAVLGPSPYKLTHKAANGRNIYSFCMCPGGWVVNSSSENERLCVNGMSYHKRDSGTANAALIVGVSPEDLASGETCRPLDGIAFQQRLEEAAYRACGGVIPYETWKEFCDRAEDPTGCPLPSEEGSVWKDFEPKFLGYAGAADLRSLLPDYVSEALEDGMRAFGRTIPGFDDGRAVLAGIEARTSSPVRILRDEEREGSLRTSGAGADADPDLPARVLHGFYPSGEGAGYAGGITSAAVDGLRTACAVIGRMR